MKSRRQQQREALLADIKQAAWDLVAEKGATGISIRAIAKQIGMTPPAIHYYYKTVDVLITELLIESFEAMLGSLVATRESTSAKPYPEQLFRYAAQYRTWALENPVQFQLIYGNPIPGYEQPTELTYPPARQSFALFASLIQEALDARALQLPPSYQTVPSTMLPAFDQLQQEPDHQFDPAVLYVTAALWSRFHGLVMLELFNLIQPVVGNTIIFFNQEVRNTLIEFGATDLSFLEEN
ncbi:MAG: TetR/AcrR family transcriptional regulator [Chloroflexota bacterium]